MSRKFFTIYNHDNPVSPSGGDSMTDPQFLADCDINTILKRFAATGSLPSPRIGKFGDFSDIGSFSDVMNRVNEATDYFKALPSDLRSRFGNEPSAYFDFVLDENNHDECIRLGIISPNEKVEDSLTLLKRIADGVTPKGSAPASDGASSAISTT